MILNQSSFRISSPITHQTFKSQKKEKPKGMIPGKKINFQIFDAFLENWKQILVSTQTNTCEKLSILSK